MGPQSNSWELQGNALQDFFHVVSETIETEAPVSTSIFSCFPSTDTSTITPAFPGKDLAIRIFNRLPPVPAYPMMKTHPVPQNQSSKVQMTTVFLCTFCLNDMWLLMTCCKSLSRIVQYQILLENQLNCSQQSFDII